MFFFWLLETCICYFKGRTLIEFWKNVFDGVNKSIPVYVPANSIEAYKKALGDSFEETSIQALQR